MSFRKILAIVSIALSILISTPVYAALVTTEQALNETEHSQTIQAAERAEVQQQLIKLGVDPAFAKERVSLMTDAEVSRLNGRLDELPAGAGLSTVDLLLIIIIILLI